MTDVEVMRQRIKHMLEQSFNRIKIITFPRLSIEEEDLLDRIQDEIVEDCVGEVAVFVESTIHRRVLDEQEETREAAIEECREEEQEKAVGEVINIVEGAVKKLRDFAGSGETKCGS